MRIPDRNGDVLLFRSALVSIIGSIKSLENAGNVTMRIEDYEGADITAITRLVGIYHSILRNWAVLEIDRPGFDGPCCALEFTASFQ